MHYRAQVDNITIEVVNGKFGHQVVKTVNGQVHETSPCHDVDYCIDDAVIRTRAAVEEARANRAVRLLDEEDLHHPM